MSTRSRASSALLGLGLAAAGAPAAGGTPAAAAELPDFAELVREHSAVVVNISAEQAGPPAEPGMPGEMQPQSGPARQGAPHPAVAGPVDDPGWLEDFLGHGQQEPGPPQAEPSPEPAPAPPPEALGEDHASLGSGLLIDGDGRILTNHHVVAGAEEIIVRLADGREYEAEALGKDRRTDLAVVEISPQGALPTATIGEAETLDVGEWVLAIGSPFGFEHSVTAGIVSAKGRSLPRGSYVPYIQTDVAINPGNSGGPLFNLEGEVVGVNAQIYSRTGGFMGLSFAIPIELAMDVAGQLVEDGEVERGWLGIMIQDVTRELAEGFGLERPRGALVSELLDDGPAAEAGLQSGDVILAFDGEPVDGSASLPPMVGRTEIGREVELRVLRDGEQRRIEIEVAELPEEEELAGAPAPPGEATPPGDERLGLRLEPLDAAERRELELGSDDGGARVVSIEEGPAADAGVEAGDVLVNFNREPVGTEAELAELVAAADSGSAVPILVIREGRPSFLAVQMP